MRLRGRSAVVTGASRGLGLRLAEALVAEGARVGMVARSGDALAAAVAAIGHAAEPLVCDVTDAASVDDAITRAVEVFGGVDILVNNAAAGSPNRIESVDPATLVREIAVNLVAPMLTARAVIPHMRAAGRGDIVNISSESATRPFPYLVPYAAAKAGLEAFTRGLREELRGDRIRVTCLRSGRMQEGGFSAGWTPEIRVDYLKSAIAMGAYHHAGMAIPPAHTARAIVDVLCLPADAHVDLIELRSNIPWQGD